MLASENDYDASFRSSYLAKPLPHPQWEITASLTAYLTFSLH